VRFNCFAGRWRRCWCHHVDSSEAARRANCPRVSRRRRDNSEPSAVAGVRAARGPRDDPRTPQCGWLWCCGSGGSLVCAVRHPPGVPRPICLPQSRISCADGVSLHGHMHKLTPLPPWCIRCAQVKIARHHLLLAMSSRLSRQAPHAPPRSQQILKGTPTSMHALQSLR
jgi:hypothetical protein